MRFRSIHLPPAPSSPPACASYDDLVAVQRFEREVREHRGRTEAFDLTPLEGRVDTAWEVRGASRNSYYVDIVSASGRHDTCTCPDFLGNALHTCKHLAAVRRAILSSPGLRRRHEALGELPDGPVITVQAGGALRLEAIGRFPARLLARVGLCRLESGEIGSRAQSLPFGLQGGRHASGVRVVFAAAPALERIAVAWQRAARRQAIEAAFAGGHLGVDVLSRPLFEYQRNGVVHLVSGGGALLADDMGLGKTVQAIAACEVLRARGEADRVLVIAPASLKEQWAREIERYAGRRAAVVSGGIAGRRAAFASDSVYKVINYELTWREIGRIHDLAPDVIILDEAQRAKNFRTKTAATLRAFRSRFLFVLTGTPIENRLDDLYSLMQLINPGVLGPLWKFNFEFHRQDDRGRIVGYKNLAELRTRISPHVLRRHKEDVLTQLPALMEQTRYTALSKTQANIESSLRGDAARLLAIAERRPLTPQEQEQLMKLLLKARQACNAIELYDPEYPEKASPKLDEFDALVTEIVEQGSGKILVFSEWVEMLKLAAERLDRRAIRYEALHGGVPTNKRGMLLDRFRSDPDIRVLLSSDAGGAGLNLEAASYVIHLDLPWNPGRLDQRTARAHRIGQTRGVLVTYLCAESGIERGIEHTLAGKRALRHEVLDVNACDDTLEVPSFTAFLRQMMEAMQQVESGEGAPDSTAEMPASQDAIAESGCETTQQVACLEVVGGDVAPVPLLIAAPADASAGPAVVTPDITPIDTHRPREAAPTAARRNRASERLRLAQVVLAAGFPADAVKAAYDALAAAIAQLLEDPSPRPHAALVAAIYRELIPAGKLPMPAHGTLARLHDLATLEAAGVDPDGALAEHAVAEAAAWVERLASASRANPLANSTIRHLAEG